MASSIILEINGESSLVFGGVAWKPLIGSNLVAQSEKLAAAKKASHFVSAGEHSAAVGTIKLPATKIAEKGRAFYSAAAVFAQAHQSGVLITQQQMQDGRVWIVGTHEGVVISDTDVLLSNTEASELIADIKRRYDKAVVISGDFDTLQYLNAKSELTPVRNAFQKIPKSLKILVGLMALIVAMDTSYSQYKKYKAQQARALEDSQFFDAKAEWANALDQWSKTVMTDGQAGLLVLFSELGQVRMKIQGWNLAEASCARSMSGWDCSTRYDAGIGATNLGFVQNMPKECSASWDGLTVAICNWSIRSERQNIKLQTIQGIQDFSLDYISSLQNVLPALRKVDLSTPATVVIPEPQVVINRGHGNEMVTVPYPADDTKGIELPSVQTFVFEGPLRTLSVLPLINDTVIKKVGFKVGSQGSTPSLRDSIFMAEVVGEFYVR